MAARRHGAEDEKPIFSELFGSAGWRSGELIKEMSDSADFYCEHMGVVRDIAAAMLEPTEALHTYEERFRPFMKTVQDGIEKNKTYWYKMPSGPILLMALNLFLAIASFFRLDVLAKNAMREDTGDWKLPDYEGMDLRKKKD
ncbi:hypothetical protein J7337_011136 [Fusarium musae]|uniref:Uncharacterized protein n=1 Tax=Fusarium musae TaxID=1042133 RepID=A0A9P8DA99_9HYPO|nr:hypothetical protein J7337_011136 [Fusarium musae]KAG9498240.1 hypothetical protein J7337_011136 [Fusarium musae]